LRQAAGFAEQAVVHATKQGKGKAAQTKKTDTDKPRKEGGAENTTAAARDTRPTSASQDNAAPR
jgi:hypothetical protein